MLKGSAVIELTDVKTGQKEVVKHDNLVTNAINDLLTLNPVGFRFRSYINSYNTTTSTTETTMYDGIGESFEEGMLPVCPNAIGGVLLYEDTLEENPDKYYAPMDNLLVGYSSNDVNATDDTRRGSLNLTESGPLEDGSGYRFVFDFATNQANGTIAALGLTSARGGKAGYGAPQDKVAYQMALVDAVIRSEAQTYIKEDAWYARNNLVAIDAEKNYLYYARLLTANSVMVGKLAFPVTSLGTITKPRNLPEVIEEKVLTTTSFGTVSSSTHVYMDYSRSYAFAGTFVDGDDGYIWGFQHKDNANGNANGSASVLWIRISKADFSFTEGEWLLDAQLFPFGMSEYNEAGNFSYYQKQMWNNSIIKDGRLYVLKNDRYGVYSIDLENPSDIVLMESDFQIHVTRNRFAYNYGTFENNQEYCVYYNTNVIDIGAAILYRNAYINAGRIWPAGYGSSAYSNVALPDTNKVHKNSGLRGNSLTRAHYGPFFLNYWHYYRSSYYYRYPAVWLMTPYLATINNLDTPVTKTADKTMKITYILREE